MILQRSQLQNKTTSSWIAEKELWLEFLKKCSVITCTNWHSISHSSFKLTGPNSLVYVPTFFFLLMYISLDIWQNWQYSITGCLHMRFLQRQNASNILCWRSEFSSHLSFCWYKEATLISQSAASFNGLRSFVNVCVYGGWDLSVCRGRGGFKKCKAWSHVPIFPVSL